VGKSGGNSEGLNANRNVDSKDCAMRAQTGARTPLGIGLEAFHVTF
jgi:hypothetical protein